MLLFYYLFMYWHGILIKFIAPLLLCVVQDSSQHNFYFEGLAVAYSLK